MSPDDHDDHDDNDEQRARVSAEAPVSDKTRLAVAAAVGVSADSHAQRR